jgi:thiol-disulfide isomerase/thioredoxin
MRTLLVVFLLTAGIALAKAQEVVEVIKFDRLHEIIESKSSQIQVINFWATWCAPCVKELPFFEALNSNDPSVKVTLINLDYADRLDKVKQYVSRKNMKADVLLLDEIDYNSWIDKVDRRWGGAIPATLVINSLTGERKFVDGELGEGDLERIISEVQ